MVSDPADRGKAWWSYSTGFRQPGGEVVDLRVTRTGW